MPKDRDRSHEDSDREERSHRSSSSHYHRYTHGSGRYRESSREHRRHGPYHRETEPHSSTHIYFSGLQDTAPSVSVHSDHVTLASNLGSLIGTRQRDGMLKVFQEYFQMLERLRKDEVANPENWRSGSSGASGVHRGANQANLVAVKKSSAKKRGNPVKIPKPSFSRIMEQYKTKNLVPAAHTKRRLHQSLSSHSEAKLESMDISLFCPLTHSRMVTPMRGKNCKHIHCFDGESFCNLMWEKDVSKWKCPICKCLAPLSDLIVDGYIMEILASVPENVKSVEFNPDGLWRIKEGTSLPSINSSSVNKKFDQGNDAVVDLTFDSPEKAMKKNSSNSSAPQVIDLTLSP